jgi:hypothetical protein
MTGDFYKSEQDRSIYSCGDRSDLLSFFVKGIFLQLIRSELSRADRFDDFVFRFPQVLDCCGLAVAELFCIQSYFQYFIYTEPVERDVLPSTGKKCFVLR